LTTTAPEPATEAPQPKPSRPFEIVSDFKLMGDQPRAVDELVAGLEAGERALTLLGAIGGGFYADSWYNGE